MSIKEELATKGHPIDLHKLQRAILMPEEEYYMLNRSKYPNPGANLMKNPNEKEKKKKTKKSKKR